MVTEAGKELLRATINTAKFHNKIIEENEMWKQWELECGLTMMVSDDDILKKFKKRHICSKHRRRDKSMESSKRDLKSSVTLVSSAGPSKADSDRWDHSGFQELYPDGTSSSTSTSRSNSAKWDHSGYHKLYPEKARVEKSSSSSKSPSSSKHKRKKKKHSRHSSDSSDNEIYEEFKKYKRSKADKRKLESEPRESSKDFDNHVKEWKKMKHKS